MRHVHIDSVGSTNSYLAGKAQQLHETLMLTAREQTAGRGQRGNHWESEPGKNLTFSVFTRLEKFPARRQFAVSEAFALAIVRALERFGVKARVKWPNDIYVGDRKICGILIEHALMGSELMHTIAGAGINVNQREFLSDAPNPVSMSNILGCDTDLEELRLTLAEFIEQAFAAIVDEEGRQSVHRQFLKRLWRFDGQLHPFRDTASGERFQASIDDVDPDGPLILRLPDGIRRSYLFKQVEFLLR